MVVVPVWLVMVVKQLVVPVCAEETKTLRLLSLRVVLFQCVRAALGGSSMLGFPHSSGDIDGGESHQALYHSRITHMVIVAQQLEIHLSPVKLLT